jgi:tetratricopeptide (TPR) repeat protein
MVSWTKACAGSTRRQRSRSTAKTRLLLRRLGLLLLISACERVRDYERAAEWCGRVGDFCGRHDIFLLNICRAHYASVLSWQGRWDEAETQLNEAVGGLRASRPPMVGDALARLGELRRRQGRLAEAEKLFAQAESHTITLLGRAQLALDRDQAEEAAELADRYLRRFPERGRVERSAGLEVAARALAGCGDLERSEDALSELRGIAARAKTRPIQAAVYATEGAVAAARGDHDTARCSFEDAIDLLTACDTDAGRASRPAATLAAQGLVTVPGADSEDAIATFRRWGRPSMREAMLEKRGTPTLRSTAPQVERPQAAGAGRSGGLTIATSPSDWCSAAHGQPARRKHPAQARPQLGPQQRRHSARPG